MNNKSSSSDNTKILVPFLKAGIKVLHELTNISFNKKKVYPLKGDKSIGEVKIEIPVIGDIETRVIFDMPKAFAFKLANLMVGDMGQEMDMDLLQSAIMELGNMISGNAMGFLEEMHLDCDIKTPKAHIGKNTQLFFPSTQIGVIEFTSEIGEFNIYVVMKEEKILDPAGILLVNITEIISNFIIEFFIPRGFSVYSTNDLKSAEKILEKQDISLVFMNHFPNQKTGLKDTIQKMLDNKPNTRFIAYAAPQEWNGSLVKKFPNSVLGYIPRSFDAIKTAKALVMVLDKIGVKYNQKRKDVRIQLTPLDKAIAIIYRTLHGEDEIINAELKDISIRGAQIEVPPNMASRFQPKQVIPRCQIKLKGSMIRSEAKVMQKENNIVGLYFSNISEEDIKKISYFIHRKLEENVLV